MPKVQEQPTPAMTDLPPNPVPPKSSLLRKLPFLVILAVAIIGFVMFRHQFSFAALADHRHALLSYRDHHYVLAALGFILAYTLIVGFSLPGSAIASMTGGLLFGIFPGGLFNVVAATIGAIAIFLAARAGFGAQFAEGLKTRGGAIGRLQTGLRENEWSVLFMMRLVPGLPFFLMNLIPAFIGIKLSRFAISTFIGIIPAALVFTAIGAGLGDVFARGETPDLHMIFTPPILLPLLGLAALSALPIIVKAFRKKDV